MSTGDTPGTDRPDREGPRPQSAANAFVAIASIGCLALLVIPISTRLLDALMVINIGLALVILVLTTSIRSSLELSAFPGMLLMVTMFRLCLNVSSARLVLSRGAEFDGNVIRAFGAFVCGDSVLLGLIVFSIMVVVQYLVITRGSERIAEVSARFHLEALPPHLMSIDGDLAGGRITPQEASARRERLERTSEFCGSMDGACKFLKGETIAGIVIVLVNLLGGSVAGAARGGGLVASISTYAILSIGDGLAQMLPAIATALAAGMLITKAQTDESFSEGAAKELLRHHGPLALVSTLLGGALLLLGLTGGGFHIWTFFLAGCLFAAGYYFHTAPANGVPAVPSPGATGPAPDAPSGYTATYHPPIQLLLGPEVLAALDGIDAPTLAASIKSRLWDALGCPTPAFAAGSSPGEPAGGYSLRSGGVEIARGAIPRDQVLWLLPNKDLPADAALATFDTRPTWDRRGPAVWLPADRQPPPGSRPLPVRELILGHLVEALVEHADEVIGIDEIRWALDGLRTHYPAALGEVERTNLPLPLLAEVVAGLVRERVSVRNLPRALAVLCARRPAPGAAAEPLIEAVRSALGGTICRPLADAAGVVRALLIDPALETQLARSAKDTDRIAIDPSLARPLLREIAAACQRLRQAGVPPVLAVQSRVRSEIKRLTAKAAPDLSVIAFSEIPPKLQLLSAGIVGRSRRAPARVVSVARAQPELAQDSEQGAEAEAEVEMETEADGD